MSVYTDYMKTRSRSRLSNDARRELILKAAREHFARVGLDGARTAELAKAAGVSERLLYKHFPSKEALHEAALKSMTDELLAAGKRAFALEPSASSLVLLTHYLAHVLLVHSPERDAQAREILRSMAGDGRFARYARRQGLEIVREKLQKCIVAAIADGDIPKNTVPAFVASYLTEAVVEGVGPWLLPDPPVVDMELGRERLIEEIVRFALRGVGLSAEAIDRLYNPKALSLLIG